MKLNYENRSRFHLTRRSPVIMRLDGKAFHTFTKKAKKPFDLDIIYTMQKTAEKLLKEIQGAKCAYVQSDEISILITDFDKLGTDSWFDYNIQKMTSISAAIASVEFTVNYPFGAERTTDFPIVFKPAYFDSRVFNIPRDEVINYFRWRYIDWQRNSIQMLAQSLFSHNELHGKKTPDLHGMCFKKGYNWSDLDPVFKNGTFYIVGEGRVKLTNFNIMSDEDQSNLFIRSILNPED
jgi:tRNA(His) guanylyltransferase